MRKLDLDAQLEKLLAGVEDKGEVVAEDSQEGVQEVLDGVPSIDTPAPDGGATAPVEGGSVLLTSSIDQLAAELGIDLNAIGSVGIIATPDPAPAENASPAAKPRGKSAEEKAAEKEAKAAKKAADKAAKELAKSGKPDDQSGTEGPSKIEGTSGVDGEKADDAGSGTAESGGEGKAVRQQVAFRMDAPIPVVKFNDLVIGYYGNILEPREEPDKDGYLWKEKKLPRFSPLDHEAYRSKGRSVLVTVEGTGRYIVGVEIGGEFAGMLEVSNGGRGRLRCRQLAQVLGLAWREKMDEVKVDATLYAEYKSKTQEPVMNLVVAN